MKSLGYTFLELVPEYRSWTERSFVFSYQRDPTICKALEAWGPRRYANRLEAYLIPGELKRASSHLDGGAGASIRFGHHKMGRGFEEKRGDYCLVAGVYRRKTLSLFYRRVELLGGFFYDQALVDTVHRELAPVTMVTVYATEACVYARKGNSNEKLFHRLREHYASEE